MTDLVKSTDKRNNETTSTTGFVRDEHGKFHIVPLKLPQFQFSEPLPPSSSSSVKKGRVRRKFFPIQPLQLTPAFFQESPKQVAKKPKVEVRKELFTEPQHRPAKRASKYGFRRSISAHNTRLSSVRNEKVKKKTISNVGTPLIDVDEAEKILTQHRPIPQRIVLFPVTPEIDDNASKKSILERIEETPNRNESILDNLEFLHFEKTLASATKATNNFCSPMRSVCSLLENAKITNSTKRREKDGIRSNILALLKEDRQQLESLKAHMAKYQEEHEKKLNAITTLIEENFSDKENSSPNRRSIRIASQTVKTKFVISPAVTQKVDLRKNALNRTATKSLTCDSPRTRGAMNMYNTFRSDCSVLCTPKQDRTNLAAPQASATWSLSRRIQKQCLMLQDTPKPK